MGLPGLKLHRLKETRKDTWFVWVNGNWRVAFSFKGKDATDVDYENYHTQLSLHRTACDRR